MGPVPQITACRKIGKTCRRHEARILLAPVASRPAFSFRLSFPAILLRKRPYTGHGQAWPDQSVTPKQPWRGCRYKNHIYIHIFSYDFAFFASMSKPKLHVAIVGAGLGGLAAAIGIARAGHKVTVLEQATVLGEVRTTCRYDLWCYCL